MKKEIDLLEFTDEWGPEKIVEVYDPLTGMKGFTVIDNTALGPAKGGIRMTAEVDVEEVFRLSRAMTLKNALAGLPFGGGKSGIIWDKKDKNQKDKKGDFIRAFARALKQESPSQYIAAPDINTSEREMQIYVNENGEFNSATGKPLAFCRKKLFRKKVCGLPHELGSTGYGVAHSTEVVLRHMKIPTNEATIAIEGFGNVGTFTFKKLEEMGAKIVAVSDSKGALYNPDGLKYSEVMKVKQEKGSVIYGKGKKIPGKKIFELNVDVLIPAALPDVINKKNMNKVKAKIIVEAANIPIPLDVEENLSKRVLIVPDFVANSGGVISSYAEYVGKGPEYMQDLVRRKLHENTDLVLKTAFQKGITPREAGMKIAQKRIKEAMLRRARK
ncbi:Glu/Leu/Phe/Val dehydrogenase [Candidatus Pacearchaeota archaeon CG10_big_fil_rev_8_21_14_0_10_35_219]|nr:Glu/Leu/Phe/Val dehydrogenase [Candidatus Pacearchaeota archaeon]PIO08236.1 MAG: Glu/Leu/Phe/Val dehydrogenase [Candidatus Pacearchaeota archaeon CG10_big_fil_rev_8_21_14_0_10_35_219]PIY81745.1 MAG: Glu/Leu/Phe/Val dehydrogenase [Candidatus Pacearchaeota archaeon CG_4_10_14_0_8_um_filter_35_169]PIZ80350.1 MAG: Glu/Leu/Phe/Val dehydrogenase [Candidatus Pacearchaeota archaeon CG_4_10_14_0_2_um_filter_35_33]PJA69962.1 MAG: Glu/Leu/Phe/Val dehydrogenase [Candidatus Pacearchaeota archaeon CG_4_9_